MGALALILSLQVVTAGAPSAQPVEDDAVLWRLEVGGEARDVGGSVAPAGGHGWLVVGSTRSLGQGGDDVWLVRVSGSGDTLWTRTLGGEAQDRTGTGSVASMPGGWLVGATSWGGPERNLDLWLVAVDSAGAERWSRRHGNPGRDQLESLRGTRDGGFVVGAGRTDPETGFETPWLLRLDARGDTLWTRSWPGGGNGHVEAALETADGGFAVASSADDRADHPIDLVVRKLDADGNERWSWRFGGPRRHVWPEWIEELPGGDLVVAGALCEPCSPSVGGYDHHFDAFVARLSRSGQAVWIRRLGGPANDLAYFLTVTGDGAVVVGGAATPPGGETDTPWLAELDGEGAVRWSRTLPNGFPRNGVAQVREVAPGELLVTGPPWLYQREGDQDLWVVRLRRP